MASLTPGKDQPLVSLPENFFVTSRQDPNYVLDAGVVSAAAAVESVPISLTMNRGPNQYFRCQLFFLSVESIGPNNALKSDGDQARR